jgi:tetratricopeptide (TPR) repeat protein
MPISMAPEKYRQGTRDIVYLLDNQRLNRPTIGAKEAINFVSDENPATKLQQAENAAYIPKKIISFKIDKEAVIRNKVVRPEDYDKIVDTMYIDLSDRNYVSKDELMILDLLATNNWERPIYWAMTVGSDKYLNLENYFQLEGFAYRLVPIKGQSQPDRLLFGVVASDIMYDNLMNKFKWGGINDPNVYIDENNVRMMTNVSNSFQRLASTLIEEGKNESAIAVIDRCFELIPQRIVPPGYFTIELANNYLKAGATEKGAQALTIALDSFNDDLNYYFSLDSKFVQSKSINEEIQRTLFFMQLIERTAKVNNQPELAKKAGEALQSGLTKFGVN